VASQRAADMLLDAGTPDRAAFARPFDVCIVGAGPAGITLARTLAAAGYDVALMEAGGLEFSEQSQALYTGEVVGLSSAPTDESRLRYFGGTTGHWEGKCRMLDASDFEPRPWMPLSGWPLRRDDLEPYAAEASAIVDLDVPADPADTPCTQSTERFREFSWRWSPPTRFGDKYRDELAASDRVRVGLNANLVDLRLTDDLGTVAGARFRSYAADDPGFSVQARVYALCMGGLENPRALLNCRSQLPRGIGNERDLVGRYFCDRPSVATADLLSAVPLGEHRTYFGPVPAFAREQGFANFALAIEPRHVRERGLQRSLWTTAACMTPEIHRLLEKAGSRNHCYWGGLSEFGIHYDPTDHPMARIGVALEQTLNPESRVTVSDDKDGFGLNRIRLDWQLTAADYRTLREGTIAFGAHAAEQDLGRVRLRDWLLDDDPKLPEVDSGNGVVDGRQHMCTTRMSDDPATGVVDADCRVHSVGNLFIGGSSVFSTPGNAKPTLTIVLLALRLGRHIENLLTA
jgi:choline dehydrogenase-like flavoprotein